jgi:hypothetical protein
MSVQENITLKNSYTNLGVKFESPIPLLEKVHFHRRESFLIIGSNLFQTGCNDRLSLTLAEFVTCHHLFKKTYTGWAGQING